MVLKFLRALLLCCFLLGALVLGKSVVGMVHSDHTQVPAEAEIDDEEKIVFKGLKRPINMLILGTDAGEFPYGAKREEVGRTDTIIMARLNPQTQTVNLLSIPRDTLVEIPGRGKDKINHAYPFGGMSLTLETVELFTGVKIDYYVKLDYRSFAEVVKALGSVEVQVTEELHHKYYDFYPGKIKMDPAQAFIYLRLRNVPTGDLARVERQQRFCMDVLREAQKPENWIKLPRIYQVVTQYVETNISLMKALSIAETFKSLSGGDISHNTVPGAGYVNKGIYYWKPDIENTADLISLLFETEPGE